MSRVRSFFTKVSVWLFLDHLTSEEDIFFDKVVQALQELMLDEKYEAMQEKFMMQYSHIFEDSEENKI